MGASGSLESAVASACPAVFCSDVQKLSSLPMTIQLDPVGEDYPAKSVPANFQGLAQHQTRSLCLHKGALPSSSAGGHGQVVAGSNLAEGGAADWAERACLPTLLGPRGAPDHGPTYKKAPLAHADDLGALSPLDVPDSSRTALVETGEQEMTSQIIQDRVSDNGVASAAAKAVTPEISELPQARPTSASSGTADDGNGSVTSDLAAGRVHTSGSQGPLQDGTSPTVESVEPGMAQNEPLPFLAGPARKTVKGAPSSASLQESSPAFESVEPGMAQNEPLPFLAGPARKTVKGTPSSASLQEGSPTFESVEPGMAQNEPLPFVAGALRKTGSKAGGQNMDHLAPPSSGPVPQESFGFVAGPAAPKPQRDDFAAAHHAVKELRNISNDHKLKLHAYFKQATLGPATGARPSVFDPTARAKWDAWAKLHFMEKRTARRKYCALVDELAPGWQTEADA